MAEAGGAEHDDDGGWRRTSVTLRAIAAAVAIRGQARALLTVPVVDGALHLPGLGRLVVASAKEAQAELEVDADWVRVRLGADTWRLGRPRVQAGEAAPVEPCPDRGCP